MTDQIESGKNAPPQISHSEGMLAEAWDYMKSLPRKEMTAINHVLNGQGTLGEYAATGLPLLAIGLATDGLGLTAMKLSSRTIAASGMAETSVNYLGFGSVGATVATGGLAIRQHVQGRDKI